MGSGCRWKVLLGVVGLWFAKDAHGAPVCSSIPQSPPTYAARIAAVACNENALWFRPFIDGNGRLASITVSESEGRRLQDGVTPAWRRVTDYWKGSGLLWHMSAYPGAADCSQGGNSYMQAAACRAFLTDTPWSAVFVSFVMNRAGVPGFHASASHVDYVRQAYLHPESGPYLLTDPESTAPAAGDLLCFARMRSVVGHQGLRDFLGNHSAEGLNMHCDIVVAANPDGDSRLYLVGGNVLQGVTMRVLPLNRNGMMIWGLARRTGPVADCRPGNETGCSFNRQDWVALLKLKPLPAPRAPLSLPPAAPPPCCTQCPLPMPAGMQRCPASPPEADPALQSTRRGG